MINTERRGSDSEKKRKKGLDEIEEYERHRTKAKSKR